MTLLRTLMMLALIVWIGGIIFFAFVLAPTAFRVLPNTTLAGNVVSRSLTALHWMGIVSALVLLICSLLYDRVRYARFKPLSLSNVLVVVMLALTLTSQFSVTPRMHELRREPSFDDASVTASPARLEFDRLHVLSTRLEGGVLLLGLAVVVFTAHRFD
jgi:uncharacterized membrane protein